MARPRVLLLCGGRSEEHEVSLASARSVLAAAGERLAITPLVISKSGRRLSEEASKRALMNGHAHTSGTSLEADSLPSLLSLPAGRFDVVFPLLHGPWGEDGSVQGLLKLLGLPFVGSGVLGSAVGMDKLMMKAVFAAHGFPQVPYEGVSRKDWAEEPERVVARLETLGYPLFVKPANLGSSVGIGKATDKRTLERALGEAARHDRRIIVERGLNEVRELEVAILGNDRPEASAVGEIRYGSDFYDYEAKYSEGKAQLIIPAPLPRRVSEQCRAIALSAFSAIDGAGLARVDFFYTPNQRLYLNEINTMPGFTTTSMYPKLWQQGGLGYPDLISRLVELALEAR
ncbi:MAG: D-alanine--D-alanine ligase [Deinococcota bacterium]|nr:D-alanine--D-alanine ligase [Deinococcota bacterium]